MSTATIPGRKKPVLSGLPVISHVNKSVGLQRGMLISGIVLTGIFLLSTVLAPLIAP